MKHLVLTAFISIMTVSAAQAHDFTAEIAKFNQVAATKKLDSPEAIQARVSLERSYGVLDQADVKLLLKIRSLTNAGFRELGEQPAFLTSEIKRLEAAIAAPKTNDPAKIAKAKEILATLKVEKPVYDALDNEASEYMKQALKLIETAPNK
jgi:fructosamine-3-kinase